MKTQLRYFVCIVLCGFLFGPLGGCALTDWTYIEPSAFGASQTPVITDVEPDAEEQANQADSPDEPGEESDVAVETAEVQNGELIVRFLDVGQGDAALISCEGQWLLIDGGPSSSSQMVYTVLSNLDVSELDYIILTHADSDHSGGVPAALQRALCGRFFCSVDTADNKAWNSIEKRLGCMGVAVEIPKPGDVFSLGGATVTFLGPVDESLDANDNSLVCRIDYGDVSFLFTGDAGFDEEEDLMWSGANLDVDVLKVGHHGSAYSTSIDFLNYVTPAYAVISVGENSYGHPTDEVLERLALSGAQVLRTDEGGSVIFRTNGVELTVGQVEYVTE